ncbi:hypothetical protein HAX54_053067 [Datura stramonium]|uniref:Uncharacterized protein n=1 Tax=Datura stramonium TaxID=4076 RepID=A0ABS8WP89_DATST|nr:hypothetical protein [Datura stramonium]
MQLNLGGGVNNGLWDKTNMLSSLAQENVSEKHGVIFRIMRVLDICHLLRYVMYVRWCTQVALCRQSARTLEARHGQNVRRGKCASICGCQDVGARICAATMHRGRWKGTPVVDGEEDVGGHAHLRPSARDVEARICRP